MDLKDQMVSVETSKSYMETDFIQKYDNVMKDKLQGLRDEFEEEAENIKNDIENNYRQKVIFTSKLHLRGIEAQWLFISSEKRYDRFQK